MWVNQLKINPDKLVVMVMGILCDWERTGTSIIDGIQTPIVTQILSLGVLLDPLLLLDFHVAVLALFTNSIWYRL